MSLQHAYSLHCTCNLCSSVRETLTLRLCETNPSICALEAHWVLPGILTSERTHLNYFCFFLFLTSTNPSLLAPPSTFKHRQVCIILKVLWNKYKVVSTNKLSKIIKLRQSLDERSWLLPLQKASSERASVPHMLTIHSFKTNIC